MVDFFAFTNIMFDIAITLYILHRNMYALFAEGLQNIFLCMYNLNTSDNIQVVVRGQ
jgi:hypothetical protein